MGAVAIVAPQVVSAQGRTDKAQNNVLVYGWFSGLSGDVRFGPVGQEVEASFGDLLDKLEAGFHF